MPRTTASGHTRGVKAMVKVSRKVYAQVARQERGGAGPAVAQSVRGDGGAGDERQEDGEDGGAEAAGGEGSGGGGQEGVGDGSPGAQDADSTRERTRSTR